MSTGRNGVSAPNRAPKGCRTSSLNCWALPYVPAARDRPTISQVMSSAKMLATYPFPRDHASKASATISRFVFTRQDLLGRSCHLGGSPHDPTSDACAILARPHRVRTCPNRAGVLGRHLPRPSPAALPSAGDL